MKPFLEREEITTSSQLVGILPGDPPRLNLVDCALGRNGVKRHFTQQVPVLDAILFQRLLAEVHIGEYIRATTVNEYTETGSKVYLSGFQKVNEKVNDADTNGMNGSTNGAFNLVPTEVPEIVTPPARRSKTIVNH